MSTALRDSPHALRASSGGTVARRAVIRWAWRMFRREWRQQLLVLALLTVAVAAATAASVFAIGFPASPTAASFGAANHLVILPGTDPHLARDLAAVRERFAPAEVIENQTVAIPGSIGTMDLRAQNPSGRYGRPMLSLVAGRYPAGPGQVAVTSQVASAFGLRVGGQWHLGSHTWHVVGMVENPQNLSDVFALLAPGQLSSPSQVTILFDASRADVTRFSFPSGAVPVTPPATPGGIGLRLELVLVLDTLGLLLIGLMAVAGFMVLAQRRLRALGMLSALGATDRNVRMVLLANGALVGAAAAVAGAVIGLAGWISLSPHLDTIAGHRINPLSLPWWTIALAMLLGVLTSIAAAWWPARAVSRIPVVAALAGRPGSPRPARRLAVLGVALLAGGLIVLAFADENGGVPPLVLAGIVATSLGVTFVGPPVIEALAAAGKRAPVAVRLALRDLARYKARSGAALAAISLSAGIAATVVIAMTQAATQAAQAAPTGPNLPASQVIVYVSPAGPDEITRLLTGAQLRNLRARVAGLAASLHAPRPLALDEAIIKDNASYLPASGLVPAGYLTAGLLKKIPTCPAPLAEYAGQLYVATPALLRYYGITPGQVRPTAELLNSRADLAGVEVASGADTGCGDDGGTRYLTHPAIQAAGLPGDTADPNTLITMRAMHALGLHEVTAGWLIQAPGPLTATQIRSARQMAVAAGVSIETMSQQPTLPELRDLVSGIGLLLALAVLAMAVGLLRSETARDLRTLSAAGAGTRTRRLLAGSTAAGLGLAGALLGTIVAYLALIAWHRSDLGTMSVIPVASLMIIVAGVPLAAFAGGWLASGREPGVITRQPLD